MLSQQKLRALLFYLSAAVFFAGLPFILSFALGYRFNPRTLKFTKSGLIVIKTQPAGADIFFEGKLLSEKSPATINELLPGSYSLRMELEGHYPWFNEVIVEAGKVTRLEKIILFPLRSDIKQLNKENFVFAWVDGEKKDFYYVSEEDSGIYKSDLGGEHPPQRLVDYIKITPAPLKGKLSHNRERLAYFNTHELVVAYLNGQEESAPKAFLLDYPDRNLTDVFWYSDNYHLVIVTNKNIEVIEANPNPSPINLVTLNKKNVALSYDTDSDTLYFIDSQKASDGKFYDNLYKIDLRAHLPLEAFIKIKPNE